VGRIGAAISGAAATTILGLLGMGVGRFEMIRTMGPVLGLSIFITLPAALTLTPALISLFGHRLFWPFHKELRQGEARGPSIWSGVARLAATATGGVITACGIILVGTFGALGSAPIQTLFQVGVAIAIGILIDTFVVRALLVPAIAAMLGRWNWWPMRGIGQ